MVTTTTRNSLSKSEAADPYQTTRTGNNTNFDTIDAAIAKCTDAKALDPTASDDDLDGYATRSICITVGHKIFLCEDPSTGAAVWRQLWPPLAGDISGALDADTLQGLAAAAFAVAAKGVTNGDLHDHSGGDGGQIDYTGLANKPTIPAGADLGGGAETVGGSASNGVATTFSRSDHKHAITNPKLDDLAAPDDNTDLNVSITKHGLCPKAPNDVAQALLGAGAWGNLPIITDSVSFTPTGSWTSNVTYTGRWRRIGERAYYEIRIECSGAPNSATLLVNIPHTIDTAKLLEATDQQAILGVGDILDSGTIRFFVLVKYNSTTSVKIVAPKANGTYVESNEAVTQAIPMTWANGDVLIVKFDVPISGWTKNSG